jgi:RHS repeat-associated protein
MRLCVIENLMLTLSLLSKNKDMLNSLFSGARTSTDNFTAYINPYLVVSRGGNYTKHIYIGSQRIVSKLGDLDSYGQDPRRIAYAGSEVDGANVDFTEKYVQSQQTIKDRYADFEVPYNGRDNDDYVNGGGFCCDDSPQLRAGTNDNPELYQYYYHSDHLGSTSLITNLDGEIVQHIEYVPFGEVFIEERNNTWNTPYLFNAKELDEETGLYYYGARYYDSRISVFLGVDLLWEKYPGMSVYAYCALNPVKFIDPDGREIKLTGTTAERQTILTNLQQLTNDKLSMRSDGTVIIVRMGGENSGKYLKAGSELIRDLNKKGNGAKTVTISIGAAGSGNSESHYRTNSTNGVGTDSNVSFDPAANPLILTKDPTTGNVSGATRPNEIGLGHELIHADRAMKGKSVDSATTGTHTYKDAAGNTVTQTRPKEELETVGVQGNYKYSENKLRKEQGLNERGAY